MALVEITNTIARDLRKRAAAAKNPQPILRAMGMALVAHAQQAFTDAGKRPQPWAPRKNPAAHNLLLKSTTLRRSLRVIHADHTRALVGSDRPYAAVHQLGGKHIPARPYFPFYTSGKASEQGRRAVERALLAALRARGL